LVSVQRGLDPREFVLVAFGGAGPLHANRLAEELDIPQTLIPLSPGTASSLGLLVTDLTRESVATFVERLDRLDPRTVSIALTDLEEQTKAELVNEGVNLQRIGHRRYAELRYLGQSYELSIKLDEGVTDADRITRLF